MQSNKKYEQITLPGVFKERKEEPKEEVYKNYAFPCGGCLCDKCVNNVENLTVKAGEQKEPCFNCDYCKYYDGKGKNNKKYECGKYEITDHEARKARKRFKVVLKRGGSRGDKKGNNTPDLAP